MKRVVIWLLIAVSCSWTQNRTEIYDVVIYGATSAGVAAAIQTSRMGLRAVILEPGQHPGGLTTGGLGFTDSGNKEVIGGISREFYQRIKKYYDNPAAWKQEPSSQFDRYHAADDAMWVFEPHVAELVFQQMIQEAGVKVCFGERLAMADGVKKLDGRIISVKMVSGNSFSGRVFIDATYEGDLLAKAGVRYTTGREANSLYGETLNGVQTLRATKHQFTHNIDPFVKPGDASSGLLHGIDAGGPGAESSGDHRIQAYNFRLCITDVDENRVPFSKPADYDESVFELLLRNYEAGDRRLPLKIDLMPNRKTDVNNNFAVSTDYIGQNYEYPDADYKTRNSILHKHVSYTKGLMWTLAFHPRMPQAIRDQVKKWGWAKDEFTDNDHFPRQMYIREARRMVSDFVTTELTCRHVQPTPEPVGMGSYNMDSHNVQRYVTAEGFVRNEGDIQESPGGPYSISYRAIVPVKEQCSNLLVPVCLSASHMAYGSIRMEPVFMILGQSAATAAVLAIRNDQAVQDISYQELQRLLLQDKQVLDWQGKF